MKPPIHPDELLDRAVAATRDEPLDPETLRAATERVGRRLRAAAAETEGAEEHRIHGCEGFREISGLHGVNGRIVEFDAGFGHLRERLSGDSQNTKAGITWETRRLPRR